MQGEVVVQKSPAVGKASRAVITASMGTSPAAPASSVARQVAAGSGEPRAEVPSRRIASVDVSGSALVVSAARTAAYFGWRAGAVRTMRSSALLERAGVDEQVEQERIDQGGGGWWCTARHVRVAIASER